MNRKSLDGIENSLPKSEAIGKILSQQNSINLSIGRQLSEYISSTILQNLKIQIPTIYSSLKIDTAEWAKAIKVSSGVFDSIRTVSTWSDLYSKQLQLLTGNLSFVGKRMAADIAAMNLSAQNLSSLGIFDELGKLLEYHKDASEAFKAANWTIAPSMNRGLREKVVLLHQQKKTRYISQVIIGHYHKNSF
jgi:hypothetical protein